MSATASAVVVGLLAQTLALIAIWIRIGYWAGRLEQRLDAHAEDLLEAKERLTYLERRTAP